MPVYIICVGNSSHQIKIIGAAYSDEAKAKAEVRRLNEANEFTRAYYVVRYIG